MGSPIPPGTLISSRKPFTRFVISTALALIIFIFYITPTTPYWAKSFETQIIHVPYIHNVNKSSSSPIEKQSGTLSSATSVTLEQDCTPSHSHLRTLQQRYGIGETAEYAKRWIRFHRKNIPRLSITKIPEQLFPDGSELINFKELPSRVPCLRPLDVPVTSSGTPYSVNATHLLFGISTTYNRLIDPKISPMKEWAHWLTDGLGASNGARLILRLVDASEHQIAMTQAQLQAAGIDAYVESSDSAIPMAKRYLALLPALYKDSQTSPQRKWLVMCDDDTFFPSMHRLINRLATFDTEKPLYIGTFSEDVNNIQRHGSQAFGGAGIFFTVPLAAKISESYSMCSTDEKVAESNTGWGPQGDILLRKCIYENTNVRLTLVRDLHQLDIMGDPSGFYESGLAPLSLHHFKGGMWHQANPYAGVQVIHTCGEDCFLQRFQTKDNFIISSGYSIAQYPHKINFDVDQMERTFSSAPDDYGWNLDLMLGPGRASLHRTGLKMAWEIVEASREGDGSVRQTYIRRSNDQRWIRPYENGSHPMSDRDGILELIWKPS